MIVSRQYFGDDMNRNNFENKFLISVVGGVIRQDDLFPVRRQLNWDRLYHLADYHHVAGVVYLGMLGGSDMVPGVWKSRFFERYKEALHYQDIYEDAEAAILTVLNGKRVPACVLESSLIRRCYEITETADLSPLRLLFPDEASFRAGRGFLIDLGYETDQYYPAFGEHMRGADDFQVEIYYHLPFLTKNYDKCMRALLKRAIPDTHFKNILVFPPEEGYIFRMAEMAYRYAGNALLLRGVLDSYRLYFTEREDLNAGYTDFWLKRLQVDGIVDALLKLGALWFGPRQGGAARRLRDNMALYDETELRILSNGQLGAERIGQAAALREQILHAAEIENVGEEHRRKLDRIVSFVTGLGKREKPEPAPKGEKDSADTGADIETTGNVTYSRGNQGTVIHTPYFNVTIPEFWLGRLSVSLSHFRENYSESGLEQSKRDPNIYSVSFSFMKDENTRARVPLLKIELYCDIDNAADKLSDAGKYYYMDGMAYYMGRLVHREGNRSYTLHIVAETYEDVEEMGRNHRIVTNMQDSIPDVLSSITPVHETLSAADKEKETDNSYTPFRDWQYGDMPQEYYYGNEEAGQSAQENPEKYMAPGGLRTGHSADHNYSGSASDAADTEPRRSR